MERLRSIHREMTFDEFERIIPVRPGWKREYYGGKAHIRPSWSMSIFEIDPQSEHCEEPPGTRKVRMEDRERLAQTFTDAFARSPEYCEYDDVGYTKEVEKYFDGFFGTERGVWSPSSRVIIQNDRVVAAALFKMGENWPILDCVFTCPSRRRSGFAASVTLAGLRDIGRQGHRRLRSCAMLANPESIAWHLSIGFRELPSLMVAQSRYFSASYEMKRLKDHALLTPDTERTLNETLEYWRAEYHRLDDAKKEDFESLFPRLEE